jgi:hypothetical protein
MVVIWSDAEGRLPTACIAAPRMEGALPRGALPPRAPRDGGPPRPPPEEPDRETLGGMVVGRDGDVDVFLYVKGWSNSSVAEIKTY